MKKIFSFLVLFLSFSFLFGCKSIELENIIIETQEINILVGETYQLDFNFEPVEIGNVQLTFLTKNASIARVSQLGEIRGINVGETKIIVMSGEVSTSINVIVNPIEVTGLEISNQEASIIVGQSFNLSASVLPSNATNKNVYFVSSDTSLASVNKYGLINTYLPGNVVVSAFSEDGDFEQTLNLEILPIDVDGVELSKEDVDPLSEKLEILLGDTYKLEYEVSPQNASNKEVEFTSDDELIASVSLQGVITSLSVGQTTITIKTIDGEFMDTIEINVYSIDVEGVEFNKEDLNSSDKLELSLNNEYQLEYEILPINATNKEVVFESNNPLIVGVDLEGKIIGLSEGEATISITTIDGGFIDTIDVIVEYVEVNNIDLGAGSQD